jgi:shikimate kinase
MTPVLVLVGAPGAGKTTVGRLVAEQLDTAFRDTDQDIETTAGKSVADIFITDGEPAFRELERAAVAAALSEHEGVLALGGGAVLDAQTRASLAGQRVAWLEVSLSEATKRVGLARERPVLALNPRATLARMLDERAPLYAEVAAVRVTTDGKTPEELAAEIAAALAVPVAGDEQ